MLSRFHLIPERHGQTDGQTDRIAISISRVSTLTRDKKKRDAVAEFCCRVPLHPILSFILLSGLHKCTKTVMQEKNLVLQAFLLQK